MSDCNVNQPQSPTFLDCWHTASDPQSVSPVVVRLLSNLGATGIDTRCRTFGQAGRQLTQCHTDAQLDGRPVAALIVSGIDAPTQVMISLDTQLVAAPAIE
jgi:hypothetical protein